MIVSVFAEAMNVATSFLTINRYAVRTEKARYISFNDIKLWQ